MEGTHQQFVVISVQKKYRSLGVYAWLQFNKKKPQLIDICNACYLSLLKRAKILSSQAGSLSNTAFTKIKT